VPGVARVDRVRYLEGVLSSASAEAEVTLRAAPPGAGPLAPTPGESARRAGGAWGARLGVRLAESLGVEPGDRLRLAVLSFSGGRPRFAFRTLEVTGTFASGFSEFDRAWVAVPPAAFEGLPGAGEGVLEVALDDPSVARRTAEALRTRLGPDALVVPWQELNGSLFAALDLQRQALFLLLGLIVVVATFNVASTLVVLVRERMRDLGCWPRWACPARAGARVPALRRRAGGGRHRARSRAGVGDLVELHALRGPLLRPEIAESTSSTRCPCVWRPSTRWRSPPSRSRSRSRRAGCRRGGRRDSTHEALRYE